MLFWFIMAFFAHFSSFFFASTSLQAEDQAYIGDRLNMETIIERYDEFKDNDVWRADVPGAYRTKWGTQIDKTCLGQLESLNKKKEDLEEWIDETVHSVIEYCGDYTQLHKYIKPWVTYLRRAVIICESQDADKYGAYAPIFQFKKTKQGIRFNSSDYFKRTKSLQRLSKSYEPTYVFTPSNFLKIDALTHEVFHTTKANSHLKHNMDSIKDGEKREKIKEEDRIYTLERICSPSQIPELIPLVLDPKLCLRIFTKKAPFIPDSNSSPLNLEEAESLCNQFKAQEICVKQQTAEDQDLPLMTAYTKGIHAILDEFLKEALPYIPQWEGHFPKKSWKLLPQHVQDSILNAVEKFKDDICFQENVHVDEVTGDLTFAWSGPGQFNFKQYSTKNLGADLFSNASDSFIPQRCTNPAVQAQLETLVDAYKWLKRLATDNDYAHISFYSSSIRMVRGAFSKAEDVRNVVTSDTWNKDLETFSKIFNDNLRQKGSKFFSRNYYKELKTAVRKLRHLYDARTCIKATAAAHQLLQLSVPSGENKPCSVPQE